MVRVMKREKSCGALVYKLVDTSPFLLLIKHKYGGHWAFPKGHVETGETEEQTALREIREETGLEVRLEEGFRESVEYCPKPYVKKQVVYFLAQVSGGREQKQEEEVSELCWCPMEEAQSHVTYPNDRRLIGNAKKFLEKILTN